MTRARPIAEADASASFQCQRDPEMSRFLAESALIYERAGYARTFVLPGEAGPIGFYTFSMYAVRSENLPQDMRAGLPEHSLPLALVGQLARDDRAKGIGQSLLVDAIKRARRVAEKIGCLGVALHAKNEQLEKYYAQAGFRPLPKKGYPRLMFLALRRVPARQTNPVASS